MSLPNLGDISRGDNKKKSVGGVDASMITRMKRDQAIVSELRTEPNVRTGVSFSITGVTADGTNPLTYTFPAQQSAPFVVGENVNISGNSGFVTLGSATAAATLSALTFTIGTISSPAGSGTVVFTAPAAGAGVIQSGMKFTVGANANGFTTSTTYLIKTYNSTTNAALIVLDSDGTTVVPTTSPGSVTITCTITFGGMKAVMPYAGSVDTLASVFAVNDLVNVSHNGTIAAAAPGGQTTLGANSCIVLVISNTSITFQLPYTTSTTGSVAASTTAPTVTPVSSRYNGTFKIATSTLTSVTLATAENGGPAVLGSFTTNRGSGTISGNLPFGSVYSQIRDGMMTRGFTDGPIMPFYARGGALGFYRVL